MNWREWNSRQMLSLSTLWWHLNSISFTFKNITLLNMNIQLILLKFKEKAKMMTAILKFRRTRSRLKYLEMKIMEDVALLRMKCMVMDTLWINLVRARFILISIISPQNLSWWARTRKWRMRQKFKFNNRSLKISHLNKLSKILLLSSYQRIKANQ